MPSLRLEIEKAMGLKFPEQNGEAIIRFEESMEIPSAAETLMRGVYRDPELVRKGFKLLQQETGSLIDILMPWRSKLRQWADSLPDRPQEAESFLRETTDQISIKKQRLAHAERDLLSQLQESSTENIFPMSLSAFGICTYREPSVKIFLKPIGRLAEISQLNPDSLRKVVRVHFLFLLLLISGEDLDGCVYARGEELEAVHWLTSIYTFRYLKDKTSELFQCYQEWIKTWGGKIPKKNLLNDRTCEKIRATMIFWRRQLTVSWEECWVGINQLEPEIFNKDCTI